MISSGWQQGGKCTRCSSQSSGKIYVVEMSKVRRGRSFFLAGRRLRYGHQVAFLRAQNRQPMACRLLISQCSLPAAMSSWVPHRYRSLKSPIPRWWVGKAPTFRTSTQLSKLPAPPLLRRPPFPRGALWRSALCRGGGRVKMAALSTGAKWKLLGLRHLPRYVKCVLHDCSPPAQDWCVVMFSNDVVRSS